MVARPNQFSQGRSSEEEGRSSKEEVTARRLLSSVEETIDQSVRGDSLDVNEKSITAKIRA